MKPVGWVSHPDDVERLVDRWSQQGRCEVQCVRQYGGRRVFAITVGRPDGPTVIFHKPHAHEPAPCAAMMNALAKLLDGRGLDGEGPPIDPSGVLTRLALTFVPDANPGGTERAPVQWWDGTQYCNEEFWVWMRGLNPQTGKMWERYDKWDMRTVEPKPASVGIVYEQISQHEYVEPNRHHDSSLFKLLFRLQDRRDIAMMVALHQTEFPGTIHDSMAILPIDYTKQPPGIQRREMDVARRMLDWWRRWGGRPVEEIKPLGYTGRQAEYFWRAWAGPFGGVVRVTSEVRNNSLLCPPTAQRRLCEAVVWACIEVALEWL